MGDAHSDENIGLRGVHVATTRICKIDGKNGVLLYRGYRIEELAKKSSFEETAFLLVNGHLPSGDELRTFSDDLARHRFLPAELVAMLHTLPENTPPMSVLQAATAALAGWSKDRGLSKEGLCSRATMAIAQIPAIVASWHRVKNGLPVIDPDPGLAHAANFLRMLHGKDPDELSARSLDMALILHAEHAFNASTFTARVTASTNAHLYSALSAAIGSLSGSLHGGANEQVMENLRAIGTPDRAKSWVRAQFDAGKRVMGMGHAVYRTIDPRALVLRDMAIALSERQNDHTLVDITEKIVETTTTEFQARKGRKIYPNVDLYSASVYTLLGIPPELFTPVFAAARAAGWSAHILEEKYPEPPVKPVIYRPLGHYEGEYCGDEGCRYVPQGERVPGPGTLTCPM